METREEAAVHRRNTVSRPGDRSLRCSRGRARLVWCVSSFAVVFTAVAWLIRPDKAVAIAEANPLIAENRARAAAALRAFEAIPLSSQSTPWELFYALMGHGRDFSFDRGGVATSCQRFLLEHATRHPVFQGSAIAAILHGEPTFLGDLEHGRAPGLEGHFCQWLFILSRVNSEAEHITITLPPDGAPTSAKAFVRGAQRQCNDASDLSWALPVFAKWGDRSWTNRFGEKLDIDSLAESHLRREGVSTVCFGTHWRMAIACSLVESPGVFSAATRRRLRESLDHLIAEARQNCDPVGRFRLEPPPGGAAPLEAVVSFQAHTLEWLMVALPSERMASEPWVNGAIARLLSDLESPNHFTFGTRCHAAAALRSYLSRTQAR